MSIDQNRLHHNHMGNALLKIEHTAEVDGTQAAFCGFAGCHRP